MTNHVSQCMSLQDTWLDVSTCMTCAFCIMGEGEFTNSSEGKRKKIGEKKKERERGEKRKGGKEKRNGRKKRKGKKKREEK